ncbi:MAG: hypothetical protein ACW98K_08045 [Candidatus Kariarchaeaceae archaeon]|jgi:hypothetical protein
MTFFEVYGRPLADFFTTSRVIIAGFVFVNTGTSSISYNWAIILLLLVIMWFTDALDGAFGRRSQDPEVSFLGRHEREIDLIYVISIHSAVTTFYQIPMLINLLLFFLASMALLQMIKSEGNLIFLQMLYISIIYGIIVVNCIIEKELFLLVNLLYVLMTLFLSWNDFIRKIKHFLSSGSKETFN